MTLGETMKTFFAKGLIVAMLLMLAPAASYAGTLSFDDIFDDGSGNTPIPYGYGSPDDPYLNWTGFHVLNTSAYNLHIPSGYLNGTISDPNVAYSYGKTYGTPVFIKSYDPGTSSWVPFNFDSAYLTAAWDNGLQIEIQGYTLVGGVPTLTIDDFYNVNATGPTLFNFDFDSVVLLNFIPTCTSPCMEGNSGYGGSGDQFAMDNVALSGPASAAEPDALTLLLETALASLLGLAYWQRRRIAF